jgi:hypothetical protein
MIFAPELVLAAGAAGATAFCAGASIAFPHPVQNGPVTGAPQFVQKLAMFPPLMLLRRMQTRGVA